MGNSRYLEEKEVVIKGKSHIFCFLKTKDAVAILPVTKEGKILLIRQLRVPIDEQILEIPAGGIEEGEEPFYTAQRELKEETGFTGQNWTHLVTYYSSPGITTETMHIYRAELLEEGEQDLDEGEEISLEEYSLEEALNLVKIGKIMDGKTILALTKEELIRKN